MNIFVQSKLLLELNNTVFIVDFYNTYTYAYHSIYS